MDLLVSSLLLLGASSTDLAKEIKGEGRGRTVGGIGVPIFLTSVARQPRRQLL